MSHLILLRHGESQLNVVNRQRRVYCGQTETPLTDQGREQARQAGRQLAAREGLQIRWAVSSCHERSRETLRLAAGELPYAVELLPPLEGLNERSLGRFEGLAEEDVFRDHPHYRDHPDFRRFMNCFVQKAPGGENLADVTLRAWSAVESLLGESLQAERAGDLLIVSHYNTIRCLLGRLLALSEQAVLDLRVPNAVPIVIRHGSRWELVDGLELP
ncbi:MAG TPA: histidine phosphatase family protein [Pirellulaceae bacterium]|nr:histidine phosphatase family protein [Pirellulaceae bacterium]